MPVYNAGAYLRPAVDSILSQTHTTLELLVIDDNSTDNAITRLAVHDPRLKILRSPSQGIINALNHGVEQSKHAIIARMDADDIAAPARLQSQLKILLENPNVDIVGSKVELFRAEQEIGLGYSIYQQWINGLCQHEDIANQIFVESPIPHPTALFYKSTFNYLGGYQDHGWPEDYDLWLRAFLAGLRFAKPEGSALLAWRDHSQRASRVDQRYAKHGFLRCKAHYLARYLTQQKGVKQCSIWGAGPTGLKLHDYLEQEGIRVTHFIDINSTLENRQKRGKAVKVYRPENTKLFSPDAHSICIIAVSARGARGKLKTLFDVQGWRETKDYLFAA